MSKFNFKPKTVSQLYVSYLHTGCCPHWNTETEDMPTIATLCISKKFVAESQL